MLANKLAFAALVGVLLLMGWLFFAVVRPLLTPLFLAAVLAVLFRPTYENATRVLGGRKRIAAAITTFAIVLLILLPIGASLILAGKQLVDAGGEIAAWAESPEHSRIGQLLRRIESTWAAQWTGSVQDKLTREQQKNFDSAVLGTLTAIARELSEKTLGFVANLFAFAVGLVVMAVALYYFFADGETFLAQLDDLSPLHYEDDLALWRQFECVSRSVVMGTVIAGLAQAILAGIGFAVAGVERVLLLAVLTWLASMLPFVGAATVWMFVCLGLVLEQRYLTAGLLAIYGTAIVSASDNLIRAYVIGAEAKLHPLVVLVSVIGGLKFIGLWGIFAGPMIAAMFYSLLQILRRRLPHPVSPATAKPTGLASENPESQAPAATSDSDGLYLV